MIMHNFYLIVHHLIIKFYSIPISFRAFSRALSQALTAIAQML